VTAGERPTFWIVAGPNGSGKSSLYGNTDIEAFDQSVWIINPDLLTKRIQDVENLSLGDANLEAVKQNGKTIIDTDAPAALRDALGLTSRG
jgi:predicted ABC-type ATPase